MSGSRMSARRTGGAVLSALAATVLCAGCTSNSNGTPVPVRPNTSASGTSSIPSATDALPSTSGVPAGLPTGVGSKDPFCTELTSANLSGLGNTGSYQKVVAVWDKLAADAPAEIKSDVQAIDTYLHDVIAGKLSAADSQAISTSAGHVGAWVATHCA